MDHTGPLTGVKPRKRQRESAALLLPLALLCLAGLSACSENGEEASGDFAQGIVRLNDSPVAVVNGSTIYDTDIDRVATEQGIVRAGESLSLNDDAYAGVLDELIDQRLLALSAKAQKLENSPEGRRRLAVSAERILGNIVVENHLAQTVTDEQALKLYEAQTKLRSTGEEIRVRHILVKTKSEAEAAAKRLDEGESFTTVAYDLSIDLGTRTEGGDLGYFQADAMVPSFTQKAFALKKDEVSPPFETEYGWHIAKLLDRREAAQLSFQDMREEIMNYMTYDQIKSLLDSLRSDANVEILVGAAPDQEVLETLE